MKAEAALRRALVSLLAAEGVTATIENIRSHPWASATFSGTRHELRLRLSDSSGCALLADLAEREFDLPGHILIDIAAADMARDGDDMLLTVEALTVVAD
ncbi:hypothetical protein [Sphingosinicella sp.]|uniref:hypothetical protein n=1 Tax=Sphingosinicella sp. TaxID=1917971 RepID=UPI004037E73D